MATEDMRLGVGSMSFKFESSYDGLISRADLKKLFWRSIPYEAFWNYERMGHIGFYVGPYADPS